MDDSYDAVLIYDGECPFCSIAATAIRRVEGVGIVGWDDSAAQLFLKQQFEDVPFALVLVDGEEELVYIGPDAATELAERAGMPGLVSSLLGERYDVMADTVQRTVGRGESPDAVRGVTSLRAIDEFTALQEAARHRPATIEG